MEKHCYVLSRCSWGYVPVLPQISADALSNTSCWFIYCLYVVYLPLGFHAKLDMINRHTEKVMFCHKSFIIRPSSSYLVFVFILESLDLWPRNAFVCQYKMSLTFVKVSVSSLSFHFSDNYTSLKVRAYARKFTLTFHLIFHLSQANKEHLLFLYQEVFSPHPSFLYFLLHWHSQHDTYLLSSSLIKQKQPRGATESSAHMR